MYKRAFLITSRTFFGITTLAALVIQGFRTHQAGAFNPTNYFSYFTNLSNIIAALILLISVFYLVRRRRSSHTDDLIRGAATLYMTITGIIYATLLSGEDVGLLLSWVNILLHYIMPIVVIADWLYQPPSTKLLSAQLPLWLIFPLMYLIYSLSRGPIAHWYPYPFLNPDKVGGYSGVALYCAAILLVFVILGWLLMQLGNRLGQRQSPR